MTTCLTVLILAWRVGKLRTSPSLAGFPLPRLFLTPFLVMSCGRLFYRFLFVRRLIERSAISFGVRRMVSGGCIM
ncbi:hypothetical protein LINPERHAP1_LOCUS1563 [Linum perenne]